MSDPTEPIDATAPVAPAAPAEPFAPAAPLDPRDRADWDALPAAAQRALLEAAARRDSATALDLPPELGGRDGPEPVRYGDYERKGLAVDF